MEALIQRLGDQIALGCEGGVLDWLLSVGIIGKGQFMGRPIPMEG